MLRLRVVMMVMARQPPRAAEVQRGHCMREERRVVRPRAVKVVVVRVPSDVRQAVRDGPPQLREPHGRVGHHRVAHRPELHGLLLAQDVGLDDHQEGHAQRQAHARRLLHRQLHVRDPPVVGEPQPGPQV